MRAQGTIVGEGVSLAQQTQGLSMAQSSCSSRHPLAALSFPDQTALRTQDESMSSRPSWSIYQSPEKPARDTDVPLDQAVDDVLLPKRSFHRRKKPLEQQDVPLEEDVLMSPKSALGLNWFQVDHSTHAAEPDLDVMMSPAPVSVATQPAWTVYQSPEKAPKTDFLWAMSSVAEQDLDMRSALGEVDVLLPKKSFQHRKSGGKALQMLHESLLMSPKQAAPEESRCPDPDWSCADSPQRPTEPDLHIMTSPPQSTRKPSAPMSPMDTSKAGIGA